MFAAAIKMRLDIARQPGAVPIPGGAAGSWFWNSLGFVTTLVAIVLALIPPADAADRGASSSRLPQARSASSSPA